MESKEPQRIPANDVFRLVYGLAAIGLERRARDLERHPWLKAYLLSDSSDWIVENSESSLTDEFKIKLERLTLMHKSSGIRTQIAVVSSLQYRWGDGAAILAESFLKPGAKSITTTGFVGGPGIGQPNDLSIPSKFQRNAA